MIGGWVGGVEKANRILFSTQRAGGYNCLCGGHKILGLVGYMPRLGGLPLMGGQGGKCPIPLLNSWKDVLRSTVLNVTRPSVDLACVKSEVRCVG